MFDAVIFTSDNDYWKSFLRGVVGDDHCAPRGGKLKEKFIEICETKIQAVVSENEICISEPDEIQDTENPAESYLHLDEMEMLEAPI